MIEIFERQPNQLTMIELCLLNEKFKRARIKFHWQNLRYGAKLYGIFHTIKPHNNSLVRLSLEHLYHILGIQVYFETPDSH